VKPLAIGFCLVAGIARATQPSDLSCEPNPSPPPGSTVPLNPLLFDFDADSLTDANGNPVATSPAPPPWDLDARYRVPAQLLQPNSDYTMTYELEVTTASGNFVTGAAADTQPPTAPGALWHQHASNANQFAPYQGGGCATDETELFGLAPSTDDLTPPDDIRYNLSLVFSDGGLSMLFNELSPQALGDGGLVIAVPYGLEGLPGDYVLQARDLAGNLSAPSSVQKVEIGPGCTFASSTTGRRQASFWPLLLVLLLLRRRSERRRSRRRSARPTPLDSRPQ
jgi:hypothetical protein